MAEKVVTKKKAAKKRMVPKRRPAKKPAAKKTQGVALKVKVLKPVGKVTHYYGGLGVAIAKFKVPIRLGLKLRFKGATTDFEDVVGSLQYDHKSITVAKKGQEVGIKVKDKVREGDDVFAV